MGSHLGSISALVDMFNVVSLVLQNLVADSSAGANWADGDTSFSYLISFEFVFILCMMREILEITEYLAQALQMKAQDIVNVIRLVYSTKTLLEQLRSDNGWETFICKVIEFWMNHGISIPNFDETHILRSGRAQRQPDNFTKDHYFRVKVFRATIGTQLTELNLKFNEKMVDLLCISVTLIPKNGFASLRASDVRNMVEKYYHADFNQNERIGLEHQLSHFVIDVSNRGDLKNITILAELCWCLISTRCHRVFNLINMMFCLLVTLTVSTASAERAFSCLKIIKMRLRNKMEDDYLANSLLIHIEGEIMRNCTYNDIVNEFKDLKERKVEF
jgi:hypothetical protein